jgi:hypothetical protein
MTSTTEEQTVPQSRNEPQVRTGSCTTRNNKSAFEHFQEYGRERPEIVALWCFGIGFVLGWKLKPW